MRFLMEKIDARNHENDRMEISAARRIQNENEIDLLHEILAWVNKNTGDKAPEADGMKECSKCHRVIPVSEFSRDKYNKDGFCSQCKDCRSPNRGKTRARIQSTVYGIDGDTESRYRRYV